MAAPDIFIAVGLALFAVFGSCVQWLNIKDKEQLGLVTLITEIASAAFCGLLIYCAYEWMALNVYIAFAVAGVIGNQGAKGVEILGKFIVKQSGANGLEDAVNEVQEKPKKPKKPKDPPPDEG